MHWSTYPPSLCKNCAWFKNEFENDKISVLIATIMGGLRTFETGIIHWFKKYKWRTPLRANSRILLQGPGIFEYLPKITGILFYTCNIHRWIWQTDWLLMTALLRRVFQNTKDFLYGHDAGWYVLVLNTETNMLGHPEKAVKSTPSASKKVARSQVDPHT